MSYRRRSRVHAFRVWQARSRGVLKQLVPAWLDSSYIIRQWKRREPTTWPLPQRASCPGLERYEYSLYSQNGEDGLLRFIFSRIGFKTRLFLEFGFGVSQNNSLRLVLKERFSGVYFDCRRSTVDRFNRAARQLNLRRAIAREKKLLPETLDSTCVASGLPSEIDLLSIDVDGNDYWFWQETNYLCPRVMVIEYNASFGPHETVSVPYDPNFDGMIHEPNGFYHGASLAALTSLSLEKGYRLVACDSRGVNAVFVREDCLNNDVCEVSPDVAFRPARSRLDCGFSAAQQQEMLRNLPVTRVA